MVRDKDYFERRVELLSYAQEYRRIYVDYLDYLINEKDKNVEEILILERKIKGLEKLIDGFSYEDKLECWVELRLRETIIRRFRKKRTRFSQMVSNFVSYFISWFSYNKMKRKMLVQFNKNFSDVFWDRFIGTKEKAKIL